MQAGTPFPTDFLQAGTPALHKSLLGHYISTQKSFPGPAFRTDQEVRSSSLQLMRNYTLERQVLLQSSDSATLEAKSMASLTGKCLISPFSRTIFRHSSRKKEVSWFLDHTTFHREHDRKLPFTETRIFSVWECSGNNLPTLQKSGVLKKQWSQENICWLEEKQPWWGNQHQPTHARRCRVLTFADILKAVLTVSP